MRISHQLKRHSQTVRLLQITDTHLFADPQACLLGVNTADSFLAVVDEVQKQRIEFDAIIATGDISQDHSRASYQFFAETLARWSQPCYWLPGNHDQQGKMKLVFDSPSLIRCDIALLGEHWQLLVLDSQVEQVPYGMLSSSQLNIFKEAVNSHPERNTLVLLHHHPLPVKSAWLDQHGLKNQDAFWALVGENKKIKGVVCGHVHQALDMVHQGCRLLASPSTCMQFAPRANRFTLDPINPGWREINLHSNGRITTQVGRVFGDDFQPDMTSSGY